MKVSLLDKWALLQAIIADASLSPRAKILAAVLLDHLNAKTRQCNPRLARIAERTGLSRTSISLAIKELIKRRWLTQKRRRGAANYSFDKLSVEGEEVRVPEPQQRAEEVRVSEPQNREEVQEPVSQQNEHDVRKTEPLEVQEPVHVQVRDSVHPETGKRETGNKKPGIGRARTSTRAPSQRGSRLPDNWEPTGRDLLYAGKKGFSPNEAAREAEKFKNHWRASSSRNAIKRDWSAAWRNWILGAEEFRSRRQATAPLPTGTASALHGVSSYATPRTRS